MKSKAIFLDIDGTILHLIKYYHLKSNTLLSKQEQMVIMYFYVLVEIIAIFHHFLMLNLRGWFVVMGLILL